MYLFSAQAADYRGYCMYMLKQLKLPPHPVSQIGWSLWLKNLPHTDCIYSLVRSVKKNAPCLGPNVSAGNGPRWRFRARQAAATLSLLKYRYGRFFLYTHWSLLFSLNILLPYYCARKFKRCQEIGVVGTLISCYRYWESTIFRSFRQATWYTLKGWKLLSAMKILKYQDDGEDPPPPPILLGK